MINVYESVNSNKRKSFIVVLLFAIFIAISIYFISVATGMYMGYEPGGLGFVGIALIVSGLSSFVSYYFSDKIVLSISGAIPANKKDHFELYSVVENLSLGAGVPTPKIYLINDTAPNAFATGRDPKHCAVAVTVGLLQKLNRTELEGVIAHELSHIKNYDTLLMTVVSVLVGTVALLGDWFLRMRFYGKSSDNDNNNNQMQIIFFIIGLLFAILSPIIAQLIQLSISRKREFLADSGSVMLTRQPSGLINALTKIASDHEPLEVANKATAHLYIENPFKDKTRSGVSTFAKLFNTHPPVEERIKALQTMA